MPLDFDSLRPPSPFLGETHRQWRDSLRSFDERDLKPYAAEWDEARPGSPTPPSTRADHLI